MANALYNSFKDDILKADLDMLVDTIKVALIDTGTYTFSQTHDRYNDVSGVVGTPQTIANPTVSGGVFDGDDVTFTSVSGSSVEALIIYQDSGVSSTSKLIAYIDTVSSGLPVTPNGGNISVTWDSGANKIFKL